MDTEPLATPPPATGTGTSTGTTSLTVSAVTGVIHIPSTVTGTGVPANTTVTAGPQAGGAGTYTTNQNTTLSAVALTFTPVSTAVFFPDFTLPVSPIAGGQPPPPAFPPPSAVPVGPLGSPEPVVPASVPPSVAGITQPVILPNQPVGAWTPPATPTWQPPLTGVPVNTAWFQVFQTTFPSPPCVVNGNNFAVTAAIPTAATGTGTSTGTTSLTVATVTNTIVIGSAVTGAGVPANTRIVSQQSGTAGGAGTYTTNQNTTLSSVALTFTAPAPVPPWTQPAPPTTASTQNLFFSTAPNIPQLPYTGMMVTGTMGEGEPVASAASSRHTGPAKRRGRSVLSDTHTE